MGVLLFLGGMEIGRGERKQRKGGEEETNQEEFVGNVEEVVGQRQPIDPFFVMRRYWKSLFLCPLVVLLLVLAASLPPVFVARSDSEQEEMDRATTELTNAVVGLRNGAYLAFVPAASMGLWATGRPNFLDQINGNKPEVVDSYYDGASPFQIASRNALDLVPQLGRGTIKNIGLAPHGVFSSIFPLLHLNSTQTLGTHLFRDAIRRKGYLHTIFRDELYLEGPLTLLTGRIIGARFPVFYESEDCSCGASFPTANNVLFRTGKVPGSLEEIAALNLSLPSFFSCGKLADNRERFLVEEGARFPTEVYFLFLFSFFFFFFFFFFSSFFCFLLFLLSSFSFSCSFP